MTFAEAFTTIFTGRARVSGRVSKPLVAARIGQLATPGEGAGEVAGRQVAKKAAKEVTSCRVPAESQAETRQHKRRNQVEAENLASAWIKAVRAGHYAYRVLKDQFDEHCEAAGVDAVSDHRFGRWLAAHGGEKYRANAEKTLMYKMPRRRAAARSGDRAAARP